MKGVRKYGSKIIRMTVKHAVWALTRVRSGAVTNSIALFTSRRSGGTWISEMIGSQDGIRTLGQPLSIWQIADSGAEIEIPVFDYGQLARLDRDERASLEAFLLRLLTGEVIVNAPWRFWEPSFTWTADRLLLKITDANSIIDWFNQTFDLQVVYLIRHPIPQALSCIELGWGLTVKAYLRKRSFVDRYLSAEQENFAWDIVRVGTQREKFVLNWVLENLVPLRHTPSESSWIWISYEEAVTNPMRTIEKLADVLDLTDRMAMKETIQTSSRTMRRGSSAERALTLGSRGRSALITRWKDVVDDREECKLMSILDRFDVHFYQYGSFSPVTPML